MNPARLLEHFDRISEAPDAVARLRRFILDLAVRGKLVEQDSKDESAPRGLASANDERFPVPNSWTWVRVSEVADCRLGKMLDKAKNKGTPRRYLRNVNVRWFDFDLSDVFVMRFEDSELDEFSLRSGDVLVCEGGEPGRAAVWDERESSIYFQKAIHRLRFASRVNSHFFVNVIRASADDGTLATYFTGVGIKHLTGRGLASFLFPLPPLPEQHRIVAKVDELMALCDRLEAAQLERERRRDRTVAASLDRLYQPSDDDVLRAGVRFHLAYLPRLTARPDQIPALRQAILNLAVRGQLAPASTWPEQPERLGAFATLQNGYAFESEWFAPSGIRLLRNANVSHGVLRWDDIAHLPTDRAPEFERFRLAEGDVVLSLDRPFIVTGTKVARVRREDLPCLLLQRVGRFQPKPERLSADYLFLWLHSPHFAEQIDPGRSNGVPHISSKQVENAEIFVPSLREQERIVVKVMGLMTLCDRLEAQLTAGQAESRRLLETVLCRAVAADA